MTHVYVPGDAIFRADVIESLPEGSVLQNPTDPRYEYVREADVWVGRRYGHGANDHSLMVGNRLVHTEADTEVVRRDTYDRFRWNWRDVTRAQALRYGTGLDDVDQVIARFHLDNSEGAHPLGSGMRIEDHTVRDLLPEGSTVYCGDPENYDHFGLYIRENAHWRHVLGGHRHLQTGAAGRVTVETIGGEVVEQPWITAPHTEADDPLITKFKAVAWRIALKAKASHSWCDALENIMSMTNVTEETARIPNSVTSRIGEAVTPAQARELPIGTVLYSDLSYFVRSATSPNRAGTVRLFSPGDRAGSTQYAMSMTICGLSGEDLDLRASVESLWDSLPAGTVFHRPPSPEHYTKAEDGGISYIGAPHRRRRITHGDYTRANFGWIDQRVVWLPGCPEGDITEAFERELEGPTPVVEQPF